MSLEFSFEKLSCRKVEVPFGTYRMIEVDGYWSVFYQGRKVVLIGSSMSEIDAMKMIDVHMKYEAEKEEELKKSCNCGGKCHDTEGCHTI